MIQASCSGERRCGRNCREAAVAFGADKGDEAGFCLFGVRCCIARVQPWGVILDFPLWVSSDDFFMGVWLVLISEIPLSSEPSERESVGVEELYILRRGLPGSQL